MQCDEDFVDITDTGEWTTKITADEVHASGRLLGSKPRGSYERKKVASCIPEQVVGGTKQIDFQDYNADDAAFGEYTFWNSILTNQALFRMGFLTCAELFYGWVDDFTVEVDDEIEEDVKGNTFISGSIYYEQIAMVTPTKITGLQSVLG